MTRLIDRGAITAAYVGIGMALTIAVSFLLVIPIEPIYWILAVPAGLLIGYYANQRSDRRSGPWSRIVANALVAGAATALTLAIVLLGVKALFFFADNGYPDFNRVDPETREAIPPACDPGAGCVFARYLATSGDDFAEAGIDTVDEFSGLYWGQQLASAGTILAFTIGGALGGGLLYGIFRPKPARSPADASPADPSPQGSTG